MGSIDSRVDHPNDNFCTACRTVPRIGRVDVGIRCGIKLTDVVQARHVAEAGIVRKELTTQFLIGREGGDTVIARQRRADRFFGVGQALHMHEARQPQTCHDSELNI